MTKEKDTNKFVLGPTPVQIKNANAAQGTIVIASESKEEKESIFKKNTKEDGMEEVLEQVNFKEKFSSLPEYKPDESPGTMPSLPSSPQLFVASYRKKRKLSAASLAATLGDSEHALGSDADTPNKTGTPRTPKTGGSLSNATGDTFFGPDFNPETALRDSSQDAGFDQLASPSPKELGRTSSLRKTLDHRRQLVMQLFQEHGVYPSNQATSAFQYRHSEAFPSKVCLQLKIREVRQKMMARSNSPTATSASSTTPETPVTPASVAQSQPNVAVSPEK